MLVISTLLLASCETGDAGDESPVDLGSSIAFRYDDVGEPGTIDQALTITNSSGASVVLDADLQALDAAGEVLPGVDVSAIYGVDRGGMVALPGENVDFLVFEGADASEVADVHITNVRGTVVDFPSVAELVTVTPLDDQGIELDYPADFSSVALQNPNSEPVTVGVVCILWDRPADGESQQALDVIALTGALEIDAEGASELDVSPENRVAIANYARSHAVSLKAYFVSE